MYIYKTNHRECLDNISIAFKQDNEYSNFVTRCNNLNIGHGQYIHNGIRYYITNKEVDFKDTQMLSYGIISKEFMDLDIVTLSLNTIDESRTTDSLCDGRIKRNKRVAHHFVHLPNNSTMVFGGDYILIKRPNLEFDIVSLNNMIDPITTISMFSEYFLVGDIDSKQYTTLLTSTHNGINVSILSNDHNYFIHIKGE
jgi:hypothetical protein